MNNDEWVYQYPIGKFVERQGWKIHISSEYNSSHLTGQDLYTSGVFGAERSILILCVVFILTVVLLQRACREELAHKGD
ncbi:putative bacteriocin [Streptococcus pneumoniae]|nr:putative bacteriocin [Streptococcus pneumoniae]